MIKKFAGLFFSLAMLSPMVAHADFDLSTDTADPLFLLQDNSVLSETAVSYGHEHEHDILRFGQAFSYGLNDRLSIGAHTYYQFDFTGSWDGFASVDLGGVYRMGRGEDNDAQLISDLILGFKFGGSPHVRTPEYADSTYYAGLRFGRQFAGVTLAATIKSTWVFDDKRGLSYIDFIPESYFRLDPNWRSGLGLTFRKSTNPELLNNQEWLNLKLVCQFGRTQYIGHFDYEFESDEAQIGAKVNILF
ncbi:MAG: hypothetical protein J5679_01415 [Alphaproteobacteria bacterium]|nr:hypothetical protein [Alphaproteobacteria bacterium]